MAKKTKTEVAHQVESIEGITGPALRRLLQRAGMKRASGNISEHLRPILQKYVRQIVSHAIIFSQYCKKKTVSIEDLQASLENNGYYLAAGLNENSKTTASLRSCNSRGKGGKTHPAKEEDSAEKVQKKKKTPGKVAIKEIAKQQKNSDSLAIPKTNFNRLVRENATEFGVDVRFSEGVIDLLQLSAEDYMISICGAAIKCCIHDKRETVNATDIRLVLELQSVRHL